MHNEEQFTDSRRKEDDFFYKRDRELIEIARRQAEGEAQLRHLAAVTGIADQEILRDLHRLGYDAQTIGLLQILPLVQVAWSDGSVDAQERERIFQIARLYHVEEGDPRWRRLEHDLDTRPSEEAFRLTLRAVQAWLQALPVEDRERRKREMVMHCTSVASVSGGLWGLGSKISDAEQLVISEIANAVRMS